jgi:redox-sensitive bicupin YhaK (pirin superfamily)
MTLDTASPVDQLILPSIRDLGGFDVRRALPSAQRRMVGPFIFLDSFGPAVFGPGTGVDTRPHPHIGLATLTYLLDGEMIHRDSEAYVQTIRPGEVNLMTAGRGIVHSERSGPDFRANGGTMSGFQAWLALPEALEETAPGFQHVAAGAIPELSDTGTRIRLLAGDYGGSRAPTRIFSDTLYADVALDAGARFRVDSAHIERAIYLIDGEIEVEGLNGHFVGDELIVFKPGAEIVLRSHAPSRLMLLGGEPLDGERHIFWNFVSSRKERIEQAAADWRERRFPGVPGETEFIPLPESPARRAA